MATMLAKAVIAARVSIAPVASMVAISARL
jgi:hypothetical protein